MNASITLTTITRALRDNAYLRPVCTALEVKWLWWDGQKTWTLLSEDKLIKGHLRSQSLEIQAEASNCITDHCVAVGRLIYSQATDSHHFHRASPKTRTARIVKLQEYDSSLRENDSSSQVHVLTWPYTFCLLYSTPANEAPAPTSRSPSSLRPPQQPRISN